MPWIGILNLLLLTSYVPYVIILLPATRCVIMHNVAGVNRYFTLCTTEFLAIGGGGHFALYLDGDL